MENGDFRQAGVGGNDITTKHRDVYVEDRVKNRGLRVVSVSSKDG